MTTNSKSWPIISTAVEENKHELLLSGPTISELITGTQGLDKNLFNISSLNYLNINQTCLEDVPDEIENLSNLMTLVLHSNEIKKLPKSIKTLNKLKVLDCSRNKLTDLPEELGNLPQLNGLNCRSNFLKTIPSQVMNIKLTTLDLSNNEFTTFPDVCYPELVHLSEIYVNGNQITEIPANVNLLVSLKVFNIADNLISVVPGELVDCNKLKDLNLKGNTLTDKRLLKLVDQCRTKQILEYIKSHCPRMNVGCDTNLTKSKKGKGKKGKVDIKSNENKNGIAESMTHLMKILKISDETPVIKITDHIKTVRPFITACIVENLSFTEDSFKKFIQFQTKLHDGICEKRNLATIATHDFNSLAPGDITYTAKPPLEIKIKPLMRNETYSAAKLFQRLQCEADNLRQEKKRKVYSGIHKYLYLLEGKALFPCLLDSSMQVISLPPITNSDITRMSVDTNTMLVEVTSASSYQVCRDVLDEFLKEMIITGTGCSSRIVDGQEYHTLTVKQIKIVDLEGNMKSVYPSRADVNLEGHNITITRD